MLEPSSLQSPTANTHTSFESCPLHSISSNAARPNPIASTPDTKAQPSHQRSQDPPDMSSRPNGNRCNPPFHHKSPPTRLRPTHFDPSFRPNIKLRSSRAIKKVIPSHPIPSLLILPSCLAAGSSCHSFIPTHQPSPRPPPPCPSHPSRFTNPTPQQRFSHLPSEEAQDNRGKAKVRLAGERVPTAPCRPSPPVVQPPHRKKRVGHPGKKQASGSAAEGGRTLLLCHPQQPSCLS